MFAKLHYKSLAGCLALLLAGVGTAAWAADVRPNVDMGLTASSQPVHVTLILKLRHEAALEDYIRQTITPGSAHYRQFLGTAEFASQYGASDADIARVQAFLRQQGLSSTVLASHLAIETSATPAQLGAMFQAPIHEYVSARSGRRFHRPATAPRMPAALAGSVIFVSGLSNERQFLSHRINLPQLPATAQRTFTLKALAKTPGGNPTATGIPGDYTVGDVANFYNINPLYQNRINQVHVDGGGVFDGGSGETALDVEQSGGIAPWANIIVYDAPNAGNGFTDAFAQAVSDNKADSISTSWGAPEIFNFAALNVNGASDTDTTDVGDLRAFHQIFLEAAVQGQS